MSELWQLDATAQAALVRNGVVAPADATVTAVERAERLAGVGALNAVVHPWFDDAAARARDAAGPLAGVPFVVKDWKCTEAGRPSTWATRLLADAGRIAEQDHELVRRYRRAGLVSIGRSNLPELAFGPPTTEPDVHGACRNPWDRARSVGGSSGGSAAAVAAGIVPLANASDGGGSLRIPAACCGLVGLKVSRGRLTNAPHPDGRGTKVEGHLARSVRDVALVLDLVAGPAPGDVFLAPAPPRPFADAAGAAPRALRVGLLTSAPGCMRPDRQVAASCVDAVTRVAHVLEALDHHVEVAHPPGLDEPLRTPSLYAAERAVLRAELERVAGRPLRSDDVEPRTWAMFELARASDGLGVLTELEHEQRWSRQVQGWWHEGWDLLLTPTLGRDVPLIGELKETAEDPLGAAMAGFPMAWFTYPFNITGQPAISIPTWAADDRLPGAAQLVAAWGREDLLLSVAAQLESAAPWGDRWPAGVE